jgi:uncharacterized membrane protein SpoIIM required for sporulation
MRAVVQTYWDLIRGAKKWLAITLGLFSLAFAGAVVVGLAKPSLIEEMVEHLPRGNETGFPAFILLVKHNVTVMLITWCGSLVLAIAPVLNTLGMGFISGGLLVDGSLACWFLAIFPHGIIELPAMLLSNTFFLKLGLRWAFQKDATARKGAFVTDFQDSLKIALLCGVLICVAATIEAFATPKILAAYEKEHCAGIGVRLAIQEHQLTINHVFPGGPASKAGLSSGLLIQKIDASATTGKSAEQCGDMIHGRVGTKVKIEVIDTAHSKTSAVDLVRELKP